MYAIEPIEPIEPIETISGRGKNMNLVNSKLKNTFQMIIKDQRPLLSHK